MKTLYEWLTSFKTCMILACIGVFNVGFSAHTGSPSVWFDVAFVLFWVWMAKKALNRQLGPGEVEVALNQDQKDRIREASQNLNTVMREVENECMAEVRAAKLKAKEKARVQSDKRKDQEAGDEGDD